MSIAAAYTLANTARRKLTEEASKSDHNLRILVSHANLLDNLMEKLTFEQAEIGGRRNSPGYTSFEPHFDEFDEYDEYDDEDDYDDDTSESEEYEPDNGFYELHSDRFHRETEDAPPAYRWSGRSTHRELPVIEEDYGEYDSESDESDSDIEEVFFEPKSQIMSEPVLETEIAEVRAEVEAFSVSRETTEGIESEVRWEQEMEHPDEYPEERDLSDFPLPPLTYTSSSESESAGSSDSETEVHGAPQFQHNSETGELHDTRRPSAKPQRCIPETTGDNFGLSLLAAAVSLNAMAM